MIYRVLTCSLLLFSSFGAIPALAEDIPPTKGKWQITMKMAGQDTPSEFTMTQCMENPAAMAPIPGQASYADKMHNMEEFEYNQDGCNVKGTRENNSMHITGECDGESIDVLTTQREDYYHVIIKNDSGTSIMESKRIGDC